MEYVRVRKEIEMVKFEADGEYILITPKGERAKLKIKDGVIALQQA